MTSVSDGLAPWVGTAGQVRVGHLIQGSRKTKSDVWEVLEMKNPAQIQYGYGMWWRVVNLASGEEAFIPPKQVSSAITFMVPEGELTECERTRQPPWQLQEWPADADEIGLLVEKLGATLIAQRDNVTGEIHCPAYAAGATHSAEPGPGVHSRDILEHLWICHGVDTVGLEEKTGNDFVVAVTTLHGDLHGPKQTQYDLKGGFPHRHAPEDQSQF